MTKTANKLPLALYSALAGGAAGAYGMHKASPQDDAPENKKIRRKNTLYGAVLGGASGAGLGTLADRYAFSERLAPPPGVLDKAIGSTLTTSAVGGAGLHAARHGTRGVMRKMDEAGRKDVQALVDAKLEDLTKIDKVTGLPARGVSADDGDRFAELLRRHGGLSSNPIARWTGFGGDPVREKEVAGLLKEIRSKLTGTSAVDQSDVQKHILDNLFERPEFKHFNTEGPPKGKWGLGKLPENLGISTDLGKRSIPTSMKDLVLSDGSKVTPSGPPLPPTKVEKLLEQAGKYTPDTLKSRQRSSAIGKFSLNTLVGGALANYIAGLFGHSE